MARLRYWSTSQIGNCSVRAEVTARQYAARMHELLPEHYPANYGGPLDPHFWLGTSIIPPTVRSPGLYLYRGGYIEEEWA